MENEKGSEKSLNVTANNQSKKVHLGKWHMITLALVAVVVAQGFLYLNLNSSYNTLSANHELLTSERDTLKNEYDKLMNNYSALQSEQSALQSSHDSLQSDYNSLESDYNSLQSLHSSFQLDYFILKSNYDSLQSKYNSLQSDFDSLQSDFSSVQTAYNSLVSNNPYVSDYDNLRNQINSRTVHYSYTNLSGFITPTDAAVVTKVTEITGGWNNTSNWNEYWSDIVKMYDWVVNEVEYRADGLFPVIPSTPSGSIEYQPEMWQFPNETLDLRKGDCEDMAILLNSMVLCYNGGEYQTECILIMGSNGGHMAVQIPVAGNKLTILDPAGNYYTSTPYGDIDMRDISTEISTWLNAWKPEMGNDAYVTRVFSGDLDKSFSSTNEYTSWMYSR